ncbi:hypothetical protein [Microbacterium jejuense]|uniref:hypothetical protein n=1 Tax=Microbacterium jejuense TaxID=1263637 RepID=UPI0031EAEAA5
MGGHSDPVVAGRIADDDALHAELNRIVGELDVQLASDFGSCRPATGRRSPTLDQCR